MGDGSDGFDGSDDSDGFDDSDGGDGGGGVRVGLTGSPQVEQNGVGC